MANKREIMSKFSSWKFPNMSVEYKEPPCTYHLASAFCLASFLYLLNLHSRFSFFFFFLIVHTSQDLSQIHYSEHILCFLASNDICYLLVCITLNFLFSLFPVPWFFLFLVYWHENKSWQLFFFFNWGVVDLQCYVSSSQLFCLKLINLCISKEGRLSSILVICDTWIRDLPI